MCKGMKSRIKLLSCLAPNIASCVDRRRTALLMTWAVRKPESETETTVLWWNREAPVLTHNVIMCVLNMWADRQHHYGWKFQVFPQTQHLFKNQSLLWELLHNTRRGQDKDLLFREECPLRLKMNLLTLGQRANDLCYRESGLLQQDRAI